MKKTAVVLSLLCAIAILPGVVSAQGGQADKYQPNSQVETKGNPSDNKPSQPKAVQGSTTAPTSSTAVNAKGITQQERIAEQVRLKVFNLADGLIRQVTREVAQVRNIISRLTGDDSAVAKLDDAGVNTDAITAKFAEATALADKAQAELDKAQVTFASSTGSVASSTVQALKNQITEARQALAAAHTYAKQAIAKIMEGRKLIGQIPGIKDIMSGTTSSATSTDDSED